MVFWLVPATGNDIGHVLELTSQEKALIGQIYFSSKDDGALPARQPPASGSEPQEHEDLPYRVELWDVAKKSVEQVLAVTANSSIGYAAYYAATRDHIDRYVTLRHKGAVLIRWNSPTN